MSLINEYIVKKEILQMIDETFDKEIGKNIVQKEEFLKKVDENLELILSNKKWDKF